MAESLLNGMEGVFIPVKDPSISAKWYEEILGFTLVYMEKEAAVLSISEHSPTVVCLVRIEHHQPMSFPENQFGVGKYYNFLANDIEETYQSLLNKDVKLGPLGGEGATKFFTFYDPDGNPLGVCQ